MKHEQVKVNICAQMLGDKLISLDEEHPHWCAAYGGKGNYNFLATSAVGRGHRYRNRPRDDAFAVWTKDQWIVAAVSDGVGSRPLSRFGSSFSVNTLCEVLINHVTTPDVQIGLQIDGRKASDNRLTLDYQVTEDSPREDDIFLLSKKLLSSALQQAQQRHSQAGTLAISHDQPMDMDDEESEANCNTDEEAPRLTTIMRRSFRETHHRLGQYALHQGCQMRDLGCTLLAVLLNVENGQMTVGHVGDGLICGLDENGKSQVLSEPVETGEVGVAFTFTQSNWERYFDVRSIGFGQMDNLRTVYLMSDGVADDIQYAPPEVMHQWAEDINSIARKDVALSQRILQLLRWVDSYKVRGSMDDRTLCVLVRQEGEYDDAQNT
jgi:serine/threonine protein phosphatase PrpC